MSRTKERNRIWKTVNLVKPISRPRRRFQVSKTSERASKTCRLFSGPIEEFEQLIPRKIEGKAKGVGLRIILIEGKETTIRTAVTVALVYYTESTSKRRGRAEY